MIIKKSVKDKEKAKESLSKVSSTLKQKKAQRFKLCKAKDDVGMRNNLNGNSINDIEFHPVSTNTVVVAYSDGFIIFKIETRLNTLKILYSIKTNKS